MLYKSGSGLGSGEKNLLIAVSIILGVPALESVLEKLGGDCAFSLGRRTTERSSSCRSSLLHPAVLKAWYAAICEVMVDWRFVCAPVISEMGMLRSA
jgi:hypothetical protein